MPTTAIRGRDIREHVTASPGRIDESAGILRDVKILGHESKNGRRYTREALQAALPMYENVRVFIDHAYDGKERSIESQIGWLAGIRLERDGLRGDLHLLQSHPLTARVLEAARRRPNLLGLSHHATGELSRRAGEDVVTHIEHVQSVDLVSSPATTAGLFEAETEWDRLLAEAKCRLPYAPDYRPPSRQMGKTRMRTAQSVLHEIDGITRDKSRLVGARVGRMKNVLREFDSALMQQETGSDGQSVGQALRNEATASADAEMTRRINDVLADEKLPLLDRIDAIRSVLDETEAAIDDPATLIGAGDDFDTMSESYNALLQRARR